MYRILSLSLYALVVTATLSQHLGAAGSIAAMTNPPPVQMLAPGFVVRELPLKLNNLNNLVYAPDGRLFALAYDGNVFQLKDTDGDGLEDTATHFYKNEKNEIAPSIGMAWGPGGLYIASRGRVIHLRDKGDGTGELVTVTEGWVPPTKAAGSSLDAIGIATDPKGTIYFGLGCDAWSEAYKTNKQTGFSDYSPYSERGTILRLSSDWKRRDIICTGVRFTVSLAFNAAGDLFCTDQEGATWLPNGNPFDELLQIVPGRHYGFPPRHPKYLPGVIDEPSVFDYRPQHQSTCGLHFNEPMAGSENVFGPTWWRGDAIVAGESRGKIWRTKLVKTAAGYVAQNNLIACLGMLTIDAVPTPAGDLLVVCHSGSPDWGTGPQGKGKIYKISYTNKNAPQPVLAYAASPTETRIVFDRPLDFANLRNLASQTRFAMGEYVSAGDQFESFNPGYKAVKDQRVVARHDLQTFSAGVSADHRSLILRTTSRTAAVNYAVTLPEGGERMRVHDSARHELPQHAVVDLLTDLSGVEASWQATDRSTNWIGWLPHLDLAVARAFTTPSAEHQHLFGLLKTPGSLALRAQIDLGLMLRTAVQPGSALDFEYPPEIVTVTFKSHNRFELKTEASAKVERVSESEMRATFESKENRWCPLEITLATDANEPQIDVTWHTAEDLRPRALPLRRVLLPWATPKAATPPSASQRQIPEIAGGNWERGKEIFFGEKVGCSKCHLQGGAGGKLGPDLSNLIHRDYDSVLRDITQPSAAINPDHVAFNIALKDGDAASGVVVEDTPQNLVLGQVTGANLVIPKSKIASMTASSLSFMPEGLLQTLTPEQQRDLMTFLLTERSSK